MWNFDAACIHLRSFCNSTATALLSVLQLQLFARLCASPADSDRNQQAQIKHPTAARNALHCAYVFGYIVLYLVAQCASTPWDVATARSPGLHAKQVWSAKRGDCSELTRPYLCSMVPSENLVYRGSQKKLGLRFADFEVWSGS